MQEVGRERVFADRHAWVQMLSVAMFCLSFTSFAGTLVWDTSATGGWADSNSYVGRVAPEEGDVVQIPANATVSIGDDDIETLNKLKAVVFENSTAKVVIDVESDHEITCSICNNENGTTTTGGSGTIEKNGTGMVWLKKNTGLGHYYAKIIVNDGILRLPAVSYSSRNQFYRSLTVNHPGVLYTTVNNESPAKVVHFRAPLYGDGMITNPSSNKVQYYVEGENINSIPNFSGQFAGMISISAPSKPSYQDFTGTGSVNSQDISILYGLSLGIADLGGSNGTEKHYGSVGCGTISFKGYGCLRYLGNGGIAYTRFEDGDAMQFAHIDAGATGGLRLLGRFAFDQSANVLKRLILSGENANECSIEGTMYNLHSGAVYLTKKGSGTWSLASETAFSNGVIAVEQGTLRFSSIRNKGVRCSLGGATILMSDYTGAMEGATPLPYAYLLGTAETTGTMEYFGADAAVCDDRSFAIKGSGRVISSGGSIVLAGGVGSVSSGDNVLYLGGNAPDCVMNNITNGIGTLKVVKEDAGDWSIGGNLGFTGGIEVKAGCLQIGNSYAPGNYTRYRLTVRSKNQGGSGNSWFTIGRFALFNEAGEAQNLNLSYNAAANTMDVQTTLDPGQFAFSFLGRDLDPNLIFNNTKTDRDAPNLNATNMFAGLSASATAFARFRHDGREGTSHWPNLGTEAQWPSIDFRLPAGADAVVRYDVGTRYGSEGRSTEDVKANTLTKNWADSMGSWTLYGSVDGVNWTELSSVTSNDLRGVTTQDCTWLSDGSSYTDAAGWEGHLSGWTIPARPEGSAVPVYTQFPSGLGKVSVAADATLRTRASFTIDSLELGAANGTIDGFAFAERGTIEIEEPSGRDEVRLPIAFRNVTGLANLNKWTLKSGQKMLHFVISADENGITLVPRGLIIVIH